MELNKSHYLKGINFCMDQSNQALTIFRNFLKKKSPQKPNLQAICKNNRHSGSQMFHKTDVLKRFAKLTKKHLYHSLLLNKLAG